MTPPEDGREFTQAEAREVVKDYAQAAGDLIETARRPGATPETRETAQIQATLAVATSVLALAASFEAWAYFPDEAR